MAIVIKSNKGTATSKHWAVRDVFFGYTDSDKANWKISIDRPITLANTGVIKYNYLKLKDNESPPLLCRVFYELEVEAGQTKYLPIDNASPFSLSISSDNPALAIETIAKIKSLPSVGQPSSRLFLDALDSVVAEWESLATESVDNPIAPPTAPFVWNGVSYSSINVTLQSTQIYKIEPLHKFYPATNNIWHQSELVVAGINDIDNPSYYKGDEYVIDRFFGLTPDGKDLVNDFEDKPMPTNPYTLEIHAALNAGKYATYTPTKPDGTPVLGADGTASILPRVANLGHLIEKSAKFIGYSPAPDGNTFIDPKKDTRLRKRISKKEQFDRNQFGGNNFGTEGTIVPWLPNEVKTKDRKDNIVDGEYEKIYTLPQLIQSVLDQINRALGIQEGSNLQVQMANESVLYPNQLAILVDILKKVSNSQDYNFKAYNSSLVTQEQTKEIIGGLGLPTVFKSIRTSTSTKNKFVNIPYVGIEGSASLQKEIATVGYNVALVAGNTM